MGGCQCTTVEKEELANSSSFVSEEKGIPRLEDASEVTLGHFPGSEIARKQQRMNEPSELAEQFHKAYGHWKLRQDPRTKTNPSSDEPYRFLKNNNTYTGQFLDGEKDGIGLEITPDGDVYTGNFEHGYRHGAGRLIYANGDVYEGNFHKGGREGQGQFSEHENGFVYKGAWLRDKKHGMGIQTGLDYRYEGEFKEGEKDGMGQWTIPGAGNYTGELKMGIIEGDGIYVYNDSSRKKLYNGSWVANKPHGQGTMEFNDGRIYSGEFVDGQICGKGVLRTPGKGVYEGEFKDGKQNGVVTFTSEAGVVEKAIYEGGELVKPIL